MKTINFVTTLAFMTLSIVAQAHVRPTDSINHLPEKTELTVTKQIFVPAREGTLAMQGTQVSSKLELKEGKYCIYSFPASERNRSIKPGMKLEVVSVDIRSNTVQLKLPHDLRGRFSMAINCYKAVKKPETRTEHVYQEAIQNLTVGEFEKLVSAMFTMELSPTVDF